MNTTSVATRTALAALPTADLQKMVANHNECVAAGMNVGQIQRDRVQVARLILAKRD